MRLLLAAGVLLAGSPLFAQEGYGPDWYDDFDKAAAAAKDQQKDLLVDFTGSDW